MQVGVGRNCNSEPISGSIKCREPFQWQVQYTRDSGVTDHGELIIIIIIIVGFVSTYMNDQQTLQLFRVHRVLLKTSANKNVFKCLLKVAGVDWRRICSGTRFQAAGPAYTKAFSLNMERKVYTARHSPYSDR